ncbi:MAG: 3-methyl-2-oxobutanoate hydroxymethyltransferase [Chloroflexi bacterium]|nr:3-methyl-2-oxobutanoate hydroxymethyltransferase [Chloroflexota bacterium]MCC6896390.1 3-methyl-2-oxobutanoate hydroxymethyltransferase [Anaerolineae bacterium]
MRITIRDIQKMKAAGEIIPMLTAYDATSAFLAEQAGVPMLLVGDSMGMVVQGHESTIPVTLDHIIYHSQIVVRSTSKALVVGDMPFMSYKASIEQAMQNAARLMQESGVGAIKVEGGEYIAPTIDRMVQAGIPVMAHIGLTPQSVNQFGGFRVQGKDKDTAEQLMCDAQAVQDAGAFAVVLELVPTQLAQEITNRLKIPTIGIGAGPHTSGQVQVFHDLLGLFPSFGPRHSKQYANAGQVVQDALTAYVNEVKGAQFPTAENSSTMSDEILDEIRRLWR